MKFLKMVFGSWVPAIHRAMMAFYGWWFSIFVGFGTKLKIAMAAPFAIVAFIPILVVLFPFVYFFHPDIGTFSDGYRAGTLTSWHENNFNIFGVTEGVVQLGTSAKEWNFSSTTKKMTDYEKFQGDAVVVHYHQVAFRLSEFYGKTDYRLVDMRLMDSSHTPNACGAQIAQGGLHDGFHTGHIVKASYKGIVFGSYEIEIQLGNGVASTTYPLSILDKKIYDCALLFMESGKRVNLYYSHGFVRNPLTQDTNENVVGIRAVDN